MDRRLRTVRFLHAIACAAFLIRTCAVRADPGLSTASTPNSEFTYLFGGGELRGWKQLGHWKLEQGSVYCSASEKERDCNLHFVGGKLPADCELEFQWKENLAKPAGWLNPGYGFNYNLAIQGPSQESYEAGVDYDISGTNIRLHTGIREREVRDNVSGFSTGWPVRDFSAPVGQWNTSRILCRGPRVEFWLNDNKTLDVNLGPSGREQRIKLGIENSDELVSARTAAWTKRTGLYLTVVAPFAGTFDPKRRVEIRWIRVRELRGVAAESR